MSGGFKMNENVGKKSTLEREGTAVNQTTRLVPRVTSNGATIGGGLEYCIKLHPTRKKEMEGHLQYHVTRSHGHIHSSVVAIKHLQNPIFIEILSDIDDT
jgi:hypothetical protein